MSKTTNGRSEAAQKRHEFRQQVYRKPPTPTALNQMHAVAESAFKKPFEKEEEK